ncbi:phosphatidylinositol-glycan biosynthesis class S protein-domain-containing protein [Abortiporus biennis]|nr:phosphatidylinositol-glycan biosynthesis class S protein-domain-containing protein [Abortiporus biennis]
MSGQQHGTTVDPSKLAFETTTTRRKIIFSYWLIVLLAIPLWWKTTSIDRLSLPDSKVKTLRKKEWKFPVYLHLESHVTSHPIVEVQKSVEQFLTMDLQQEDGISVHVTADNVRPGHYRIALEPGWTDPLVSDRSLSIDISRMRLSSTLLKLLAPPSPLSSSTTHRVVKYSPIYRLAFTLLNEDASSGQASFSWEIEKAIKQYFEPVMDALSVLHNFTVESQVQMHAPLAFTPSTFDFENQTIHCLTQEDLTVFVNSAEWALSSSVSNDPVIHFILFVPSAERSPLRILDHDGNPTSSNAFILPQWGGITILNEPQQHLTLSSLTSTFFVFQEQLLSLLGLPSLPRSVRSNEVESLSKLFTDWQLDALVRQRALENVKESQQTLESITALVRQIENMPVGEDVKGDVQGALNELELAHSMQDQSISTLYHSAQALKRSSRAFFNPGMLALLYFPAEHKYAVYTPLFASVAAPLVAAVLREFAAWKKERKAKEAKESTESEGNSKTK